MSRKAHKVSQQRYVKKTYKTCFYCGDPKANTIDHRTPVCRGGSGEQRNLVLSCAACNNKKADMTVEEYYYFLTHGKYAPSYIRHKLGKDPNAQNGRHKSFFVHEDEDGEDGLRPPTRPGA